MEIQRQIPRIKLMKYFDIEKVAVSYFRRVVSYVF